MNRLGISLFLLALWVNPDYVAYSQQRLSVESDLQPITPDMVEKQDVISYYAMTVPTFYSNKRKGNYLEAIADYQKALPYVMIFDKEQLAELYMGIAGCYSESGQNKLALENYLKALDHIYCNHPNLYKQHTETIRNRAYVNMGAVYNAIGDYKKSIAYCDKAIPYFEDQKSYRRLAAALGTKAIAYRSSIKNASDSLATLTLFKSAYQYAYRVLPKNDAFLRSHDLPGIELIVRLSYHLSDWYIDRQMPDSAAFYLNNVRRFYPFSSRYAQAWLDINTARMYAVKGNWNRAYAYLFKVLDMTGRIEADEMIKGNVHFHFYEFYSRQGKFEKALTHFRLFHVFWEESKELEKLHRINNLEIKYLTERKDREIAEKQLLLKNKESQLREKSLLLYAVSAGCLLLMGMSFAIYRSYRHKKLLHRASLLNMKQEQKITNLQSRVAGEEQERNRIAKELHDGTVSQLLAIKLHLNAIGARGDERLDLELEEVTQRVEATAQELRQTAHKLMPSLILHHGLSNAIAFYCDKVQQSSGLSIEFHSIGPDSGLFTEEEVLSVFRIFQELIQNVLKHAQATMATVQLSQRDDMLTLTVEDNGTGCPAGDMKGMGLKSIEERVQLLNGFFDIRSTPGRGTTAYVEIREQDEGPGL